MRRTAWVLVAVSWLSAESAGLELKPATLAAYERYVAATEERIAAERAGSIPLLWMDRQPQAVRTAVLDRLRRGEVVAEPLETHDANGRPLEIDGGRIHHWVGTVMLPDVSIDRMLAFVQDYDRYPQVFAPLIQRARIVEHSDDHFVVEMRTSVSKVITVVMDGDYVIDYRRLGPSRVVSTSVATHLLEVHDAGQPDEQRVPADQASGNLWRYRMYCAIDVQPDGRFDECESITLTRRAPALLSWLVSPLVRAIPRETLAFTLDRVRAGLTQ